MNLFTSEKKKCSYCGMSLGVDLICTNVKCKSHEFSVGNRVILFNRRDYGSGFIEKILDYKTPYEFCYDFEQMDKSKKKSAKSKKSIEYSDMLSDEDPNDEFNENLAENTDGDSNLTSENQSKGTEQIFFEKPIYQVKFKLYFDKIVPAEELRHEIFEKDREVRTIYGKGIIKNVNIREKTNFITYDIVFEDQNIRNLKENEILEYVYNPLESFLNFKLSDPVPFALNYIGKLLYNTYSSSSIKFITNSRLSLMPHQVYVAHELIMKYLPRVILADEVGLGKTIEAGIFIKEMISRDLAKKILIVVPANLVDQWIFEFSNKFSIKLEKFDAKFVKNLDRCNHPNVFYRVDTHKEYPYIICSLQMARLENYRTILTSIYWDIVCFDEAHHLRRYISSTGKYDETLAYLLARKLGEKARSLLLLTATPIQLHSFDLYSLLQLIRPDVFNDYLEFESERKRIPIINMLLRNLQKFRDLNNFQQTSMIDLIHSILMEPPLINKSISQFYDSAKINNPTNLNSKEDADKLSLNDPQNIIDFSEEESIEPKIGIENLEYLQKIIDTSIIEPNKKKIYSYESIERLIRTSKGRRRLIKKVRDYHFLSHFMFRNRKRKIFEDAYVKRIVENINVVQTDEEANLYKEIRLFLAKTYNRAMDTANNALGFVMTILQKLLTSSPPALITSLERRINTIYSLIEMNEKKLSPDSILFTGVSLEEEDWDDFEEDASLIVDQAMTLKRELELNKKDVQVLEDFLERLKKLKKDTKLETLEKLILRIKQNKKEKNNKVIIFTQFKKTLFYIKEKLENLGFTVAEFHGDLSRDEKNEMVEEFRNEKEILISTEVGGEGRNFQFCHILVNYDLPWNPMKLEQRIGRLDRIGQEHDVYIYNFKTLGTVESRILDVLTDRIKLFEESIGNLEPIVANIQKNINKTVLSDKSMLESMGEFEQELIKSQNKLEEVEAQLDDFVLDKKSFQMDKIGNILSKSNNLISEIDVKAAILEFIEKYYHLNKSAGTVMKRKLPNKIPYYDITIDEEIQSLLDLPSQRYKGVFDLDIAHNAEEVDFFALGHPLVNAVMNFCRTENIGNPSGVLPFNFNKIIEVLDRFWTQKERNTIKRYVRNEIDLFFISFESEYNGIFREKKIHPVVISSEGDILEILGDFLSRPHNLTSMINANKTSEKSQNILITQKITDKIKVLPQGKLNELIKIARTYYNKKFIDDKSDLIELNETMFQKELQRILSLHEYKRKYILNSIEMDKNRLKYLEKKQPTKRQWMNLEKIEDIERRQEKEEKYNRIIREMQSLNLEIDEYKKQLDDLEFDLPDDVKKLEFYRKLTKRTWLSSIAIIVNSVQ